ncbi:MAG TPA: RusA family crossover junction endodeoxyribonuclease [Azospirillaceae bacterium]|nr:RusA family crossover junction endodeoxyribonuclease [Azospirillaceae bacterium]
MPDDRELYPFEFYVKGTPVSAQTKRPESRHRWVARVREAAEKRVQETVDFCFLDKRPVGVRIIYFPDAPMDGDVDNIAKPIIDALIRIAYMDDKLIESVQVQKQEPGIEWAAEDISEQLAAALDAQRPVVYIRVDDHLGWRRY